MNSLELDVMNAMTDRDEYWERAKRAYYEQNTPVRVLPQKLYTLHNARPVDQAKG